MEIGIDLRLKEERPQSVFYSYLIKSVTLFALHHPEHSFTIYNMSLEEQSLPENLSIARRAPEKNTWINRLFRKPVKETRGYLIECFDTTTAITPGAAVIIEDLGSLVCSHLYTEKEIRRLRKLIEQAVRKAVAVVVPSLYYIDVLQKQLRVPAEKLHLFPLILPPVKKIFSWEERERVKDSYTKGKEYFLYAGDLHQRFDLLTLLKAFSQFKKWQKSGMQLVIAGYETVRSPLTTEMFSTYKYRHEVILLPNPTEQALNELTAAAYAFIYPAFYDPFPLTILQAINMQVPVISSDIPEVREMAGDSVVYTEMKELPLSAVMQKVYKDETWRKDMITNATYHFQKMQEAVPDQQANSLLNELIAK